MILHARHHRIAWPRRPLVMGIINVNDDSFSGDGTLDVEEALDRAARMVAEGADIIDAGAESARTNREPVTVAEEIRRLAPFIEGFRRRSPGWTPRDGAQVFPPLLSLNTWRPEVAEALLPLGGDILNDIGALPDDRNARLCARHGAALLIMHSVGQPKVPHTHVGYVDIMETLDAFFTGKIALARAAGLADEQIILDPGIDFAKQRGDNLRIYAELERLNRFGRPVLLPVSRKTVIGRVLDLPQPTDRDAGTLACVASGLVRGAAIFRVHAVAPAAQAVKILHALQAAQPSGA